MMNRRLVDVPRPFAGISGGLEFGRFEIITNFDIFSRPPSFWDFGSFTVVGQSGGISESSRVEVKRIKVSGKKEKKIQKLR